MTWQGTLGVLVLLAGLAACSHRAPTLPPVSTPPPIVEETRNWEDWGPEENQKAREAAIDGQRLRSDAIQSLLSGRILRGCYPSGEKFAERLDSDGRFYDALKNNEYLGTWEVRNAMLCFRYPDRAQQGLEDSCFAVIKTGSGYDFYSADLTEKVASTSCQ